VEENNKINVISEITSESDMNVAIDSTKLHIFKFKQPSCLANIPFELAEISNHKIIPLDKIRRLENEEENSLHLAVVSITIYTGSHQFGYIMNYITYTICLLCDNSSFFLGKGIP